MSKRASNSSSNQVTARSSLDEGSHRPDAAISTGSSAYYSRSEPESVSPVAIEGFADTATTTSAWEEIQTHLLLVCLVAILFGVAIGAVYAQVWAKQNAALIDIPAVIICALKIVEIVLFVSGCLSAIVIAVAGTSLTILRVASVVRSKLREFRAAPQVK